MDITERESGDLLRLEALVDAQRDAKLRDRYRVALLALRGWEANDIAASRSSSRRASVSRSRGNIAQRRSCAEAKPNRQEPSAHVTQQVAQKNHHIRTGAHAVTVVIAGALEEIADELKEIL